MAALAPLAEKLRPGLLSLADEDDISELRAVVLLYRDPRTPGHCENAMTLELAENFLHPPALDVHPGQADDVGAGAACKVDWLDVLVD